MATGTPAVDSIDGQRGQDHLQIHEPMLKESINHFLAGYRSGSPHLSAFGSIFFRLVRTIPDPPLEIIWFYSAVTFHTSKSTLHEHDPSMKLVLAKDLFQLLVSCSSPCNGGEKKVALLAPVVCELYHLTFFVICSWEPKLMREIEVFVQGIVSHISICLANDSAERRNGLENFGISFFEDLLTVWTVDRNSVNCKLGNKLNEFFPLLIDDFRRGIINAGHGIGYIAPLVMIEVLLLGLCVKFKLGLSRVELLKDVQNWIVQTMKGLCNWHFLDMLLRMLLEPSLPVTTLLHSEDEILVRKELYDAVILMDFSLLAYNRLTQPPCGILKDLALMWLLVADSGIEFVRKNCDYSSAVSYIQAFSRSHLANQLIKWVSSQIGMEVNIERPNISTPKAFIKWLLVLQDQGLVVFDSVPKIHVEAACKSGLDYELTKFDQGRMNSNEHRMKEGDEEMADSMDDKVAAAVCIANSTSIDVGRKRKDGIMGQVEMRFKLVKYDFHEDSIKQRYI